MDFFLTYTRIISTASVNMERYVANLDSKKLIMMSYDKRQTSTLLNLIPTLVEFETIYDIARSKNMHLGRNGYSKHQRVHKQVCGWSSTHLPNQECNDYLCHTCIVLILSRVECVVQEVNKPMDGTPHSPK